MFKRKLEIDHKEKDEKADRKKNIEFYLTRKEGRAIKNGRFAEKSQNCLPFGVWGFKKFQRSVINPLRGLDLMAPASTSTQIPLKSIWMKFEIKLDSISSEAP